MPGQLIIENKGVKTDKYIIPPFDLHKGEIVVIYLYNGAHLYDTEQHLVNIFTGNTSDPNVKIHSPFTFVPRFSQSALRSIFCRVSVGEYLRKHALQSSSFANKIYDNKFINKHTKVDALAGNPRKLLSLYSVLSKTNLIIFDVHGQDPEGAAQTYKIVKEVVNKGGAAIFLDGYDDMKTDCTKYIELEWLT